jgi:uncharacterized protein (TIGR02391 family)
MRVLEDFAKTGDWNSYNWLNLAGQEGTAARDDEMLHALAEAWQWLYANQLVAVSPGQSSTTACFVTRRGRRVLDEGLAPLRAMHRIADLHPLLGRVVEQQFQLGQYELGVFAALRAVEIRVREAGSFPNKLLGTPLMQEAFKPDGPLADPESEEAEQVARMNLYKGAIGLFKNPSSHRPVDYGDPATAAEIVLLADLLLRLIDLQPPGSQVT